MLVPALDERRRERGLGEGMVMVVSMARAVVLARSNGRRRDDLLERHRAVEETLGAEAAMTQTSRATAHAALVELTAVFSRVRGAQLHELAESAGIAVSAAPHVALPSVRPAAGGALLGLAGGVAAGSAAGALTVSAVGALATASTGTAISGLSGAAASSATLAWLGGGSLAAGGGGVAAGSAVLVGVVAAPVVLSVAAVAEWQGRRLRRTQVQAAAEIDAVDDALSQEERDAQARVLASTAVSAVLCELEGRLVRFLPALERAVETTADYAAWTPVQRRLAAHLAAVATCAAEVMAAAPHGSVGALAASDHAVVRARRFLGSLEDERVAP